MTQPRGDLRHDPLALTLDLGLPPPPKPVTLSWPDSQLDHRSTVTNYLPLGRLSGFSTSLFVQAFTNEAQDVARLIEHTRVGAVFTLDHRRQNRSPLHRALAAVDHPAVTV